MGSVTKGGMVEFFEVVEKRRSIRKFTDRPVEKEKIEAIIDAAMRAPSARNSRSSEFIIVSDRPLLSRLSMAKPGGAGFIKDAPLAIAVFADPQKSHLSIDNAAIAAAYIQLAARALGLGSCWSHMRGNAYNEKQSTNEFLAGLLQTPGHLEVVCVIAIGYPDEEKAPYLTDELQTDAVHWDKY
jgi:nitroreductase